MFNNYIQLLYSINLKYDENINCKKRLNGQVMLANYYDVYNSLMNLPKSLLGYLIKLTTVNPVIFLRNSETYITRSIIIL